MTGNPIVTEGLKEVYRHSFHFECVDVRSGEMVKRGAAVSAESDPSKAGTHRARLGDIRGSGEGPSVHPLLISRLRSTLRQPALRRFSAIPGEMSVIVSFLHFAVKVHFGDILIYLWTEPA